jgi:hypothetical protein
MCRGECVEAQEHHGLESLTHNLEPAAVEVAARHVYSTRTSILKPTNSTKEREPVLEYSNYNP